MSKPSSSLLQFIRMIAATSGKDARSDAELLACFVENDDENAFATLVVRHAQMVWRICRRIVGNHHDAEDALQSTFLTMARKAKRIHIETAAGWLHQVARRAALDARKAAESQRKLQGNLHTMARPQAESEAEDNEVYEALHEDLAKMPERLRVPLVLHYLEGKTRVDVGRILGVSESAVRKRLERGLSLLQKQLNHRGFAAGTVVMGTLLAETASPATIPPGLVSKTVKAATAFRDGMLTGGIAELTKQVLKQTPVRTSWWMKGWVVWVLVGIGGLGAGMGGLAWRAGFLDVDGSESSSNPSPAELYRPKEKKPSLVRQDIYGDPLPPGAIARIGTMRFRPGNVNGEGLDETSVAFGPDGKTIFSTHQRNGGVIHVWETATGKEVRRINGPLHCKRIAISPDGKQLAAAGVEGEVWSWKLRNNSPSPQSPIWRVHRAANDCKALVFSPNGKMLAWGQNWGQISLRDAGTGNEIRQMDDKAPFKLAFSPDGTMLAAWTWQDRNTDSVRLWDVATGAKLHTLYCSGWVASFAFSPDNATLATVSAEQIVELWDVATGAKYRKWWLGKDAQWNVFIAYLPDGKTLLTSENERIRFWDPSAGKECRPALGCPGLFAKLPAVININAWVTPQPVCRNVLSSDGRWLASANDVAVNVWDVATGKQVGPAGAPTYCLAGVAFSPDGKTLATDTQPGVVELWDAETGKPKRRLNREPLEHFAVCWNGLHYAEDGRLYTFRTEGHQFFGSGTLVGWDAQTGASVRRGPRIPIQSGWAVAPDGGLVAVTNTTEIAKGKKVETKCEVVLYELPTGKKLRNIGSGVRDTDWRIPFLAFSDDGRYLVGLKAKAGGDSRQAIEVWDVATGRSQLGGQAQNVEICGEQSRPPLAFSPDGRWLVAAAMETGASVRYVIQFWEVASGAAGLRLPVQMATRSGWIACLAFSPDGRTIVVGGGENSVAEMGPGKILLLDMVGGKMLGCLTGHLDKVTALAFSADGSRLVSNSSDGTALVWDVPQFPRLAVMGKNRPKPEVLWVALTGKDAAEAYRAICQLSEIPEETLSFLRGRLQPSSPSNPREVDGWLADLNAGRFEVRKRAFTALKKCGPDIEGSLRRALKQKPEIDVRRRLEELIERLSLSPQRLSMVREVEVLERLGTAGAQRLLEKLARPGETELAEEAQAALRRLAKRKAVRRP